MKKNDFSWFIFTTVLGCCLADDNPTVTVNIVVNQPPSAFGACGWHDQCPASKACIEGKCSDPCEDVCGKNASCTVLHHIPACACKEGFTGNPFLGCSPQEPKQEEEIKKVWPPLTGKKQFHIDHRQVDWNRALKLCLQNNSRLVTFDNRDDFEELTKLIDKVGYPYEAYWTSASDLENEGNFIWASTGRYLSSTSDMWAPNEPDNNNYMEHCVDLWKSKWGGYGLHDTICEKRFYFACEYYV